MMSTVVSAPAVVWTMRYTCLHTVALNLVQPNLSTTRTVAAIKKTSAVSVYRAINSIIIQHFNNYKQQLINVESCNKYSTCNT